MNEREKELIRYYLDEPRQREKQKEKKRKGCLLALAITVLSVTGLILLGASYEGAAFIVLLFGTNVFAFYASFVWRYKKWWFFVLVLISTLGILPEIVRSLF